MADKNGSRLFLFKQLVQFFPGLFCLGIGNRFSFRRLKVITKIGTLLVTDPLRLVFSALMVGGRIVEPAVETAVEIPAAFGTGCLPADFIFTLNIITAMITLHGFLLQWKKMIHPLWLIVRHIPCLEFFPTCAISLIPFYLSSAGRAGPLLHL